MPSINSLEGISAKIIAWHRELIELQTNRERSCWIWTKSLNWDGYAHTRFGGRSITVHRVSYLIHKGDIPTGMVVRHCCPGGENRACVNPDHLILNRSSQLANWATCVLSCFCRPGHFQSSFPIVGSYLGSKGDNNRDTVLRGKGGRGGPKTETNAPLRIETASLASDGIIYELSRKRLSPSSIAARIGLPREHVLTVIEAICDNQGRREASRLETRFWSKVNKTDNCWLWRAMIIAGYGRLRLGRQLVGAHQISWRLHRGPIPDGLVVCHNCPGGDTPHCVNPLHLFVASQTENLRDGARKKGQKQPSTYSGEVT